MDLKHHYAQGEMVVMVYKDERDGENAIVLLVHNDHNERN